MPSATVPIHAAQVRHAAPNLGLGTFAQRAVAVQGFGEPSLLIFGLRARHGGAPVGVVLGDGVLFVVEPRG